MWKLHGQLGLGGWPVLWLGLAPMPGTALAGGARIAGWHWCGHPESSFWVWKKCGKSVEIVRRALGVAF